jgi:hypothetical protein
MSKITVEIVNKFSSLMFGVRTYNVRLPFHLASLVHTKLRLPSDMMEYMNKDHGIKGSVLFLQRHI